MPYTVSELARYGFLGGDASDETPNVGPLPWEIDKPAAGPSALEVREKRWSAVGTVVGVVGGLLGIALSLRALASRSR